MTREVPTPGAMHAHHSVTRLPSLQPADAREGLEILFSRNSDAPRVRPFVSRLRSANYPQHAGPGPSLGCLVICTRSSLSSFLKLQRHKPRNEGRTAPVSPQSSGNRRRQHEGPTAWPLAPVLRQTWPGWAAASRRVNPGTRQRGGHGPSEHPRTVVWAAPSHEPS